MKEVQSIEELVTGGESDLQELVDAGNSVAREWMEKLKAAPDFLVRLSIFGEMRIALLGDARPEARIVEEAMFSGE